jgi:hypothetical protein
MSLLRYIFPTAIRVIAIGCVVVHLVAEPWSYRQVVARETNSIRVDPVKVHHQQIADYSVNPKARDEVGRLGNYRVLRIVGSGSMGTVYEAEDLKLYRRVALKVMKKARARNITNREQFLHEARRNR